MKGQMLMFDLEAARQATSEDSAFQAYWSELCSHIPGLSADAYTRQNASLAFRAGVWWQLQQGTRDLLRLKEQLDAYAGQKVPKGT